MTVRAHTLEAVIEGAGNPLASKPIYDPAAEASVIGSLLITPQLAQQLANQENLTATHFFLGGHRDVYQAVLDMLDEGVTVAEHTLVRRLRGNQQALRAVAASAGELDYIGAVREHARRIIDCHRLEQVRDNGLRLAAAAVREDREAIDLVEQQLAQPADTDQHMLTGMDRKLLAIDRLEQQDEHRVELPWWDVNRLIGGGLKPGAYMLLGGWSAHGKSVAVDQALEHAARRGHRVALYLTETTEEERTDRAIARNAGIPHDEVQSRADPNRLAVAIHQLPDVAVIEAHDWTVGEIARHVRHHRWDLCAVDVLHDIQHREERDLAEIGRTLLQVAKRTRTRMIVAVHLNDNRITDEYPPPVPRDIRGSGMLYRQSDITLFVWREQDDDGNPVADGLLKVAKCRGGRTGMMGASFNGSLQRWEPFTRISEGPA